MAEILEMVRWAPSAVNKQPWRILKLENAYHFFEKKDKGYISDAVGDMQKIDMGIALCHFVMGLEEKGMSYEFALADPGIVPAADEEYIATIIVEG